MRRFAVQLIFFSFFTVAFILGRFSAAPAAPKPTDIVAQVDTYVISVETFQKKLVEISPANPDKNLAQRKQIALEQLINGYLTTVYAQKIPLENDTAFVGQANYLLAQFEARELFNREIAAGVSVAEDEIADRYAKHPEEYKLNEWVEASHILISPVKDTNRLTIAQRQSGWWADTDKKALAIVDSIHRMAVGGFPFDSLARLWSQDGASAIRGGRLDRFGRGIMVREFDSAVFNLKPGEMSRPVKTQFGYHIIKVTAKQPAGLAPLSDSLKEVITTQIRNEKMTKRAYAYLDSIQQKAGVVFNEETLNKPDSILRTEKLWAAASVYGDTVWSGSFGGQLFLAHQASHGKEITRDQKIAVLKNLINPLLVRRASADIGIPASEAYLKKKDQIYQGEKLSRASREAAIDYRPTDEEVRNYYRERYSEFAPKETLSVNVQQIVFKTEQEALRARQELSKNDDFAALAKKYYSGEPDIGEEAFDLGFISPPAMPKTFFAVAETLALYTVSQPVKTEWGYHLIRVAGRKPDLSFESVRSKIMGLLQKAKQDEHRQKWETSLREGRTIKVEERVLRRIKDPLLEKKSAVDKFFDSSRR